MTILAIHRASPFLALSVLCALAAAGPALGQDEPTVEPTVFGDYFETRSHRVGAAATPGRGSHLGSRSRAVLAWRVTRGVWNGVDLSGLAFVAVVESDRLAERVTRGSRRPRAKTVFHVDRQVTPQQERALLALASELAAPWMRCLVEIRRVKIDWRQTHDRVELRLGERVRVRLDIEEHDHALCRAVCARDPRPLAPLAKRARVERARAEESRAQPDGRWTSTPIEDTLLGRFGL